MNNFALWKKNTFPPAGLQRRHMATALSFVRKKIRGDNDLKLEVCLGITETQSTVQQTPIVPPIFSFAV